jgi:hypothetical protein
MEKTMSKDYIENPKLVGTDIIDCIPQTGECPHQCPECFYNGGRFFRDVNEPWIPTSEQIGNKIVRVNSGNDSNNNRKLVIEKTKNYEEKFYNTSVPKFDFPGPVVFTCNGGPKSELKFVDDVDNLMFVRVRVNSWDMDIVDSAVAHYWDKHKVPVVLTFMRYYNQDLIPEWNKGDYEWRKSILNDYWCLKQEVIVSIMARYKGRGVRMCGTPVSSTCIDCRNCELLYYEKMVKNHGVCGCNR